MIHESKVKNTYEVASKYFSSNNKSRAWAEKADIVVKEPNIPIVRNKKSCDFASTNAKTMPIRKHPIMFISNILIGKNDSEGSIRLPNRYLNTDPKAPPKAIMK